MIHVVKKIILSVAKRVVIVYTKLKNSKKLVYGLNKEKYRSSKIIVSLTSYEARFSSVVLTLKSLLVQTVKPDKIIVWLDCDRKRLTNDMIALEKYGIEYRCNVNNIRSHEKYYFAMQEFKEDIIITVDDDCIYPPTLIKSLLKTHEKYPNCVCARRVHEIKMSNNNIMPYMEWQHDCVNKKVPSNLIFATGVGGVLYPPVSYVTDIFDANKIIKLSYTADDVWLKFMEIMSDIKVVWAPNFMPHPMEVINSQNTSLREVNITENFNDVCISNMMKEYGKEVLTKICD